MLPAVPRRLDTLDAKISHRSNKQKVLTILANRVYLVDTRARRLQISSEHPHWITISLRSLDL